MDLKIDITNPNAITYITEELGFTISGGIRMDGLDRLRVSLRKVFLLTQGGYFISYVHI